MMVRIANGILLKVVKQEVLGRPLCNMLLATPEYGQMFKLGAMAWHLLTDDNKQKIKDTITKSPTLSKMSSKFLIIAALAEYVPKMDFNVIPESFKEVLKLFGVSPDVNAQLLISELNNHIDCP
jgi:hypothetical protein